MGQEGRQAQEGEVRMSAETKKVRGVFEKVPGSGVWWICYFDADGGKRREKAGRKSAAIDLYRKRKTSVLEGRKLPEKFRARAVPFSELAKDALEYSRAHKLSYGHDVYRMTKLTAEFGGRAADNITPQTFERWIADHQNWKPATANRYRALLSLVYRLGVQNRKVIQNPARLMRHRKENNSRLRWLTREEEKKLRTAIEVLGAQHLPEFDLALHTGLRRSEQYRLTWDCVDLERQILTVPQSKNGEIRHVPLNSAALTALLMLKKYSSSTGRVFRATGPRQWFDPAVQNSGLTDFTWHCLRHTFASRLVMAGVDLRTVQELMGHKTISMTCRYAHLAPSHKLAAVERLANLQESSSDTTTDTSNIGTVTTDHASVH
jgi:site-specific recombinase XerD